MWACLQYYASACESLVYQLCIIIHFQVQICRVIRDRYLCSTPQGWVQKNWIERRSECTVGYKKRTSYCKRSHTQETSRPLSLFINLRPCRLMCSASLIFLGMESVSWSTTEMLSQFVVCRVVQTCFALADFSDFPFLTASLCCLTLVDWHRPVSPMWW